MSNKILQQLTEKIDIAIETIGLLRLQIEELEESNQSLIVERDSIINKQSQFETNVSSLIDKLKTIDSYSIEHGKETTTTNSIKIPEEDVII